MRGEEGAIKRIIHHRLVSSRKENSNLLIFSLRLRWGGREGGKPMKNAFKHLHKLRTSITWGYLSNTQGWERGPVLDEFYNRTMFSEEKKIFKGLSAADSSLVVLVDLKCSKEGYVLSLWLEGKGEGTWLEKLRDVVRNSKRTSQSSRIFWSSFCHH